VLPTAPPVELHFSGASPVPEFLHDDKNAYALVATVIQFVFPVYELNSLYHAGVKYDGYVLSPLV
jgi:hypothetical protein